jgi:hypothetical protein
MLGMTFQSVSASVNTCHRIITVLYITHCLCTLFITTYVHCIVFLSQCLHMNLISTNIQKQIVPYTYINLAFKHACMYLLSLIMYYISSRKWWTHRVLIIRWDHYSESSFTCQRFFPQLSPVTHFFGAKILIRNFYIYVQFKGLNFYLHRQESNLLQEY